MGCNSSKGGEVSTGSQNQGEATPRDSGNQQAADSSNGKQADGFQNLEETQTHDDHADKHEPEPEVTQQQQQEQKTTDEPETKQEEIKEE